MEAKSFRVGNVIGWRLGTGDLIIGNVHSIEEDKIGISKKKPYTNEEGESYDTQGLMKIKGIEPIPLTEELFIKLGNGFSFAENFSCYWRDGYVCIEQFGEGTERLEHIKYVHQYQNLVHALTNTELTINL